MAVHTVRRTKPAVALLRQGKILLVEERTEERARMATVLADEGHQVRECSSCSRAIDLLADESFDIVLLGQGTRAEQECEVVEWARAADPKLPVVMLVNDPEILDSYEPIRREVAEYVPKPISRFEVNELKETVRRYMKPRVFVLNLEKASQ
jgi:DNA-binding NtrC family response regulator